MEQLPKHLIAHILIESAHQACWFLSRSFSEAKSHFDSEKSESKEDGVSFVQYRGHIYAKGNNVFHQVSLASSPWVSHFTPIRLPAKTAPADRIELRASHGSVFVLNRTHGTVYAWGCNTANKLGMLGPTVVTAPRAVRVQSKVSEIIPCDACTFFRAVSENTGSSDWFGAGDNDTGCLGLGHTRDVTHPTRVPWFSQISRVWSAWGSTFMRTDKGALLACGSNDYNTLGHGTESILGTVVPILTPVSLGFGRNGPSVTRVVRAFRATFIIVGRRCFVCGINDVGQLGQPSQRDISTPVELDFPVDDVASFARSTVFRTESQLIILAKPPDKANGDEMHSVTPTQLRLLSLPWAITRIIVGFNALFVKRADSVWLAWGADAVGQLGVGSCQELVSDWAEVKIDSEIESIYMVSGITVFRTVEGFFACGRNESSELGVGTTQPTVFIPMRVESMSELPPECPEVSWVESVDGRPTHRALASCYTSDDEAEDAASE
ncbi:BTK-BINDING PROTEIN-RELATED [Carpediemonas membranifera]|uniref:BTK-BINDING PROTEIN-RELATED n=1 Tax=Carpediemonas membranifera TaxID=201153 RepID=A0A8J6BAP4_9EUKA|nr:BTK-BINDING PROTEIN-RELATED [Carpediemonas membranifera]|eukprot:KAG9393432.1 BTK-BINDING PROTEIN-RELATED [Carpediemonas membranifera]